MSDFSKGDSKTTFETKANNTVAQQGRAAGEETCVSAVRFRHVLTESL